MVEQPKHLPFAYVFCSKFPELIYLKDYLLVMRHRLVLQMGIYVISNYHYLTTSVELNDKLVIP